MPQPNRKTKAPTQKLATNSSAKVQELDPESEAEVTAADLSPEVARHLSNPRYPASTNGVMGLQRTVGNRATTALVRQRSNNQIQRFNAIAVTDGPGGAIDKLAPPKKGSSRSVNLTVNIPAEGFTIPVKIGGELERTEDNFYKMSVSLGAGIKFGTESVKAEIGLTGQFEAKIFSPEGSGRGGRDALQQLLRAIYKEIYGTQTKDWYNESVMYARNMAANYMFSGDYTDDAGEGWAKILEGRMDGRDEIKLSATLKGEVKAEKWGHEIGGSIEGKGGKKYTKEKGEGEVFGEVAGELEFGIFKLKVSADTEGEKKITASANIPINNLEASAEGLSGAIFDPTTLRRVKFGEAAKELEGKAKGAIESAKSEAKAHLNKLEASDKLRLTASLAHNTKKHETKLVFSIDRVKEIAADLGLVAGKYEEKQNYFQKAFDL